MNNRTAATAWMCLALAGCAATPGRIRVSNAIPALDLVRGQALEGYDTVAYFDGAEAARGRSGFSYRWQGADWLFSSSEHRDAFAAAPEHYAPQYGGYCAFAVSRGTTAHGDPKVWAVVDGKLYLNNNRFAQELWNEDRPGHIAAADQNWPLMPKLATR
jgi:YHS domain-containing protein